MDCLPLSNSGDSHSGGIVGAHPHIMSSTAGGLNAHGINTQTAAVVGVSGGVSYNLQHHPHHLLGHHTPYSNNYPLHHSSSHHHIHSDQTKSLQELQHEVVALLEFRDLVIETFPDLKHKMASMSSSSASTAIAGNGSVSGTSVSGTNTLTCGAVSNSSMLSRREWEPGIRLKRKLSQKEPSTSTAASTAPGANIAGAAGELSSSSLTRSRSNSHSGKKEPKSGENNNGSVVQDSGFSTETSSSKEGHSASSTNGAMTGPTAHNRLSCLESDDELLNLLDVIHRKSNRLREEMDHLQNYERQNLRGTDELAPTTTGAALAKSSSGSSTVSGLTPKTFREHIERLNKEDIKQLRKERDRLLDKLAEMEAETLTGRIKAAKMSDKVEELVNVKKDLEEQLKLAMAQKLELSSRVQQLQQQQLQSKSSSSQSDYSSQRNFLSSATTVLSTGSGASVHVESGVTPANVHLSQSRRQNTFQPVVVEVHESSLRQPFENQYQAFHQSAGSDIKTQQLTQQYEQLGRLDGIVSTPGTRNSKCRATDSKRFAAILLETSVVELQRHLLTLTVQNQVLMQKLDQAAKSKTHLAKRLDKSKDDVEDLRFQLEEKNIELEGTKAQLRVLESRIHSATPSSSAATNSYLHSQNDYETNRSSASTTLMLSRRGITSSDSHYSDMRSATPISATGQMPQPNVTQISTPSMKAMIHLPMDEMQQHSSSTESAHDHENELQQSVVNRMMSTSVGGVSPFEQTRGKKSGAGSKPSKIPLPGSKAASYFSGKPPSGRPSTAGRSPPSTHTYAGSNSSSKSSLSRSTGNLLYSKSPNSLKRADSAQSIRKENSSMSAHTSRSSTSSIPLATMPNATSKSPQGAAPTPSPRVLQNSPLPKLKRETLTSRVRHLDSLSRVHQLNHSNISNGSDVSCTSPTSSVATTNTPSNYVASSTPKMSSIAAHLNSTLRKDLQLNMNNYSHGSQQFLRRATGSNTASTTSAVSNNTTARRFSSASVVAARIAGRNQTQEQNGTDHQQQQHSNGTNVSDSDSGKHSLGYEQLSNCNLMPFYAGKACLTATPVQLAWPKEIENSVWQRNLIGSTDDYAVGGTIATQQYGNCFGQLGNQYKSSQLLWNIEAPKSYDDYSHDSFLSGSENGSDKLLVTFDYGYSDSLADAELSCDYNGELSMDDVRQTPRAIYAIEEEQETTENIWRSSAAQKKPDLFSYENQKIDHNGSTTGFGSYATECDGVKYGSTAQIWFNTADVEAQVFQETGEVSEENNVSAAFKVHHMQHNLRDSVYSLLSGYTEYDVDVVDTDSEVDAYAVEDAMKSDVPETEKFYDSLN